MSTVVCEILPKTTTQKFQRMRIGFLFFCGLYILPSTSFAEEGNDFYEMYEMDDPSFLDEYEEEIRNIPPPPPPPPPPRANRPERPSRSRPQARPQERSTFPSASSPTRPADVPNIVGETPSYLGPQTRTVGKAPKGDVPSFADAQLEDITDENYPDIIESFDYPNADIREVVKAISQLTGKNFIVDPSVRGTITIMAPTQITVAEAYRAFLSALTINNLTLSPSGRFLKVVPLRVPVKDTMGIYSGAYFPDADIPITRIIHLKHISAGDVANRLQQLITSAAGSVIAYDATNSLIISDMGSSIERAERVLKELDRPGFEEQLEVIPIRHARARNLADLINQIISRDPTGGAQQPGQVPRFRPSQGRPSPQQQEQSNEDLSLVAPDERTNAIIVLGNKAGIKRIQRLVKQLDYKLDPSESGGVFVYYVKHSNASDIANTLTGLAESTRSGDPTGDRERGAASPMDRQTVFGGDVRITSDENTNSLIITASRPDYETILSLLGRIDIPRDQVFVEAIIMEMSVDSERNWNPNVYVFDPKSGGRGRQGFITSDVRNLLNPASDRGAIFSFADGKTVSLQIGAETFDVKSLMSFIQVLQTYTESNILSTPQILAMDNETALIEVGDQVPVGVDVRSTDGGVQNQTPRFENATIRLEITPHIRPDSDIIRMKVDQSIKQLADVRFQASQLADIAQALATRQLQTNLVIRDGDTAVLGGLVREEERRTEQKIPLLGDIPILGWLFKSSTMSKTKANLMVFITPRIIRNLDDNQKLLSNKANERIDWIRRNMGGRDPYGEKIHSLPRAAHRSSYNENMEPKSEFEWSIPTDSESDTWLNEITYTTEDEE